MISGRWGPALLAWLVASLLLAALARPASAETRRVLVFPLTGSVPGDPGDALARLTQVVARSAGLTGAEVIVGQVTFDDTAALAGCASPDAACLTQVARELHVDHVVLGTVEAAADSKSATVSLTAFVNGAVTQRTFTLPATSVDAMVESLARDVPSLFVGTSQADPPAEPVVTKPAAAVVPTGPELVPAAPPREDGFRRRRVSAASWWLAGGGLVLAGTGAAMLFLASDRQAEVDAAPVTTVMDLERLQAIEDEGERYNLLGQGLLLGGGVAFVAGAVLVLYQGHAGGGEPRRVAVDAIPLRGGAGLSVRVTLP